MTTKHIEHKLVLSGFRFFFPQRAAKVYILEVKNANVVSVKLLRNININHCWGKNTHKEDEVEEEEKVLGRFYASFSHGAGSANRKHNSHITNLHKQSSRQQPGGKYTAGEFILYNM